MTAFGCDSGWDGCVGVGETTWLVYVGICVLGLIGVLIWSLVSSSPECGSRRCSSCPES